MIDHAILEGGGQAATEPLPEMETPLPGSSPEPRKLQRSPQVRWRGGTPCSCETDVTFTTLIGGKSPNLQTSSAEEPNSEEEIRLLIDFVRGSMS